MAAIIAVVPPKISAHRGGNRRQNPGICLFVQALQQLLPKLDKWTIIADIPVADFQRYAGRENPGF
ncbi:MAG: hypothetical protein LBE24_05925 [Methylobacillus sp.]|jgi:hypothetical protein|nr:hypothetical protein [Methylobacillus sp.]